MIYAVIIILIVLVLILSLKLAALRKQMRRIAEEMRSNEDGRDMNVDFVDSELQKLLCEVNRLYEYVMSIRAEGRENEKTEGREDSGRNIGANCIWTRAL